MNPDAWGGTIQSQKEQFKLRRGAILAAAAQLFRDRGYENVSIPDIALELQVATATVYYYFKNKDMIVRELADAALARFMDPGDHPGDFPAGPGLLGAARLERFIRRLLRFVADDVGSCIVTLPHEMLEAETRRRLHGGGVPVEALAMSILREGVEDGSLARCDVTAAYYFIVGALRYVPVWTRGNPAPAPALADSFVELVMRGLCPKA